MKLTVDIMPGAWICDKCGFILDKKILAVNDGQVYADTSPLNEHCPNDNRLMRPLTWREVNESLFKACTDNLEEKKRWEAAKSILIKGDQFYKEGEHSLKLSSDEIILYWFIRDALAALKKEGE